MVRWSHQLDKSVLEQRIQTLDRCMTAISLLLRMQVQCIQFFFQNFDFKKSISGLIELKFSVKTPNEVLYAPIYFLGVYF